MTMQPIGHNATKNPSITDKTVPTGDICQPGFIKFSIIAAKRLINEDISVLFLNITINEKNNIIGSNPNIKSINLNTPIFN